jgi:fumarylacetoacetase
MIAANNPSLSSWINVPENSDFPIQNLPFGVFKVGDGSPRAGVAIGNDILDLSVIEDSGLLDGLDLPSGTFSNEILNDFMALGKSTWTATRNRISELLQTGNQEIQGNDDLRSKAIVAQSAAIMAMPMRVGDYTDFYASKEHATNVGTMFRDPNNALLPNWLHIPVGYHGRASSVVISVRATMNCELSHRANELQPTMLRSCRAWPIS